MVGSWFHVRECLSESSGIRTHRGRSIDDGRPVVIKVISENAVHPGSLMRLEYEATHLARLHSPWLAPLVYVGRENGQLQLVYEHAPGIALRDCLQSRSLSLGEALVVGRAIFSALRDMHLHGLLHRGVRPSNIIVNDARLIKRATVVDWDVAGALVGNEPTQPVASLEPALYSS